MPGLADRALGMLEGRQLVVRHDARWPLPPRTNVWQRVWTPDHAAGVWPAGGPYDSIVLPLPRGKDALRFCLHACASVLHPHGKVILFGDNDLGIKSAGAVAGEVFAAAESVYTGDHGRIWILQKPQDFKKSVDDFVTGNPPFQSFPGVFAGGQLDEATALLIQHLPDVPPGTEVLDFACGIGLLAGAMLYKQEGCIVTASDHDPLAIRATSLNVAQAKTILSGGVAAIQGTFDLVISNPPIHEGNTQSFRIVGELVAALPKLLKPAGQAYLVTQVTVPVARLAKDAGLQYAEVAATRSFRVSRVAR
ncbi:MAG: methyltransferase [Bdellovibrionales bacterium]